MGVSITMREHVELTAFVLQETLDYLPDSGLFVWKIDAARNVKAGSVARAGSRPGCHIQIKIRGRLYYAHRLAWLHTHGEWPKHFIDHIDGDKSNNRLANLRDVSRSVNGQNQRKAMRDNKSGMLGVSVIGARFRALIVVEGMQRYLGTYDDAKTAHAVYLAEKRRLHAGCSI